MHHELHTEIDIAGPSDVVWHILSDLDEYPTWNPFIVSAEGDVAVGERLTNRHQPPGGRAITATLSRFEAMNEALESRAEARVRNGT